MTQRFYYLSEMAVSDRHGGGLTLERILDRDLESFDEFIHLALFASKEAPIMARFADRQCNLHERFPMPIHGRITRRIDPLLERIGAPTSLGWLLNRWIRRCALELHRRLPLDDAQWLVVPQDMWSVRVANELWRLRKIRYVTWVMDDHVVRWNGRWEYPPGFEADFGFHLRHATRVLVISDAMARCYESRFQVKAEVLFGPADPVGNPVLRSPDPEGPVRLCYFGAIRPWQRDALADLVGVLELAGATLDLFGLQAPPPELLSPAVNVRSAVPADRVLSLMRQYDGVVVPASFLGELRHLSELNIATKLSECYASGTVPIIVGPSYAAMVQFGQEHGGTILVTDVGNPEQVRSLRELKRDAVRAQVLAVARRVSETVCSTAAMRRVWARNWAGGDSHVSLASRPLSVNGHSRLPEGVVR